MLDQAKLISAVKKELPLYAETKCDLDKREKCWNRVGKAVFHNWDALSNNVKKEYIGTMLRKWRALRNSFVRRHRITRAGETTKGKYGCCPDNIYEKLLFIKPYTKAGRQERKLNGQKTDTSSNIEEQASRAQPKRKRTIKNTRRNKESTEYRTKRKNKRREFVKQSDLNLRKRYQRKKQILPKPKELTDNASNTEDKSTSPTKQPIKNELDLEIDTSGNRSFLLSCLPCLDSMSLQKCLEVKLRILKDIQEVTNQKDTKPAANKSPSLPLRQGPPSSTVEERIHDDADIFQQLAPFNNDTTIAKIQSIASSIASVAQDGTSTGVIKEVAVIRNPNGNSSPYQHQNPTSTTNSIRPVEVLSDDDEIRVYYELMNKFNTDIKSEFKC